MTAPRERPAVVMLKAEGVDVVSGGEHATPSRWSDDGRRGQPSGSTRPAAATLKTVVRDGVLTGFVSVGLPRAGAELTLLFERGSDAARRPARRCCGSTRPTADCASHRRPARPGRDRLLVQRRHASAASPTRSHAGSDTVECVGRDTRAGTGCGGCKGRIAEVLAAGAASRP